MSAVFSTLSSAFATSLSLYTCPSPPCILFLFTYTLQRIRMKREDPGERDDRLLHPHLLFR
ncbi:hypothetical protein Hanom_Chr03g00271391 [Helianthus anomalus]